MNSDKQQIKLLNKINREIGDLKDELHSLERSLLKKRIALEALEEQKRLLTHYGLTLPENDNGLNGWWIR